MSDTPLLSRIVAAECASCNCDTKTHEIKYHYATCRYRVLSEAYDTILESEQSFEIRWAADMRAIKRWQEDHPGNDLVWPDHVDLVIWLLEKLEAIK